MVDSMEDCNLAFVPKSKMYFTAVIPLTTAPTANEFKTFSVPNFNGKQYLSGDVAHIFYGHITKLLNDVIKRILVGNAGVL